jgi:hypothetical protein
MRRPATSHDANLVCKANKILNNNLSSNDSYTHLKNKNVPSLMPLTLRNKRKSFPPVSPAEMDRTGSVNNKTSSSHVTQNSLHKLSNTQHRQQITEMSNSEPLIEPTTALIELPNALIDFPESLIDINENFKCITAKQVLPTEVLFPKIKPTSKICPKKLRFVKRHLMIIYKSRASMIAALSQLLETTVIGAQFLSKSSEKLQDDLNDIKHRHFLNEQRLVWITNELKRLSKSNLSTTISASCEPKQKTLQMNLTTNNTDKSLQPEAITTNLQDNNTIFVHVTQSKQTKQHDERRATISAYCKPFLRTAALFIVQFANIFHHFSFKYFDFPFQWTPLLGWPPPTYIECVQIIQQYLSFMLLRHPRFYTEWPAIKQKIFDTTFIGLH